jgi:hypothetical protein
MASTRLAISGLSSLDAEELREALGGDTLQIVRPESPEGTLAEPVTITAIIVLGSIALTNLAVWICKKRRHPSERFKFKLTRPDGEVLEVLLDTSQGSEEPCKEGVLSQLGQWIKIGVGGIGN